MTQEFPVNTGTVIEEMVNKSYRGISCKICEEGGFGILFRLANKTNKTNYGCYKCITNILEKSFTNDSDTNKHCQDLINYLKPEYKK